MSLKSCVFFSRCYGGLLLDSDLNRNTYIQIFIVIVTLKLKDFNKKLLE